MHLEAVVHAHAAAFLAHTPWDVAHDEALLADAHSTAWRCYGQRWVTVTMDPTVLELESWGATLHPPCDLDGRFACGEPLIASIDAIGSLPDLDPGRHEPLARAIKAAQKVAGQIRATTMLPVCGPVSLLRNLIGAPAARRLLVCDEQAFAGLLTQLCRQQMPWVRAITAAGIQPIVVGETLDPELHEPARFARVVMPALATMAAEIHRLTHVRPPIMVEGNTTSIVALLAEAGAGAVACGWGAGPVAFLNELRAYSEIIVRLDVARGMWVDGEWHEVCRRIADASRLARFHPNLVLGTGTLPVNARSVLVVDAFSFAENIDPWMSAV